MIRQRWNLNLVLAITDLIVALSRSSREMQRGLDFPAAQTLKQLDVTSPVHFSVKEAHHAIQLIAVNM